MAHSVSADAIRAAYSRISPFIHRTPVLTSETFNKLTSREVTHSSGNAGQAIAWAAAKASFPCCVVMPRDSAQSKIEAVHGYGAEVVTCEPTPDARQKTCDAIADERNYAIILPYDDVDIITGQATLGLELMEQVPELDAILVATGGGGLISGVSLAAHHFCPRTKVFAVEPLGKELEPSLRSRSRLWPNPPQFVKTIADALRGQQPGHITFPIMCEHVQNHVFTVNDEQIKSAMKFVWERMKVIVEPAGATGPAALLDGEQTWKLGDSKRIGVILCGGNADLNKIPWMM